MHPHVAAIVYCPVACMVNDQDSESLYRYSTAHVQVYIKTRVTICASRNFAFNSCVGLMRRKRILLASDN